MADKRLQDLPLFTDPILANDIMLIKLQSRLDRSNTDKKIRFSDFVDNFGLDRFVLKAGDTIEGDLLFNNDIAVTGKVNTGVAVNLIRVRSDNVVRVGDQSIPMLLESSTQVGVKRGGVNYGVHDTGTLPDPMRLGQTQTVTGQKTFTQFPLLPSTGPTSNLQATSKQYVDNEITSHKHPNISVLTGSGLTGGGDLSQNRTLSVDATVVRTTGGQNIAGTKTFTDPMVLQSLVPALKMIETDSGEQIWQIMDGGNWRIQKAGDYASRMIDVNFVGDFTGLRNPRALAAQDSNVASLTRKDYVDGQIATRLPSGGTAVAADKLATARTISLGGDVSGSVSFDGTQNITITATVADDSHNHIIGNVDGLQTALNEKVAKTGDTMTGALTTTKLTLSSTGGGLVSASSLSTTNKQLLGANTDSVFVGNTTIKLFFESSVNPTVRVGANNYTIYHTGNNPTAAAVGAVAIGGNAGSADKLSTARTISLGGDVSGSVSFDGTQNITITATVADDSHNHVISNVDGLQAALDSKLSTSAGNLTGVLQISVNNAAPLILNRGSQCGIRFNYSGTTATYLGVDASGVLRYGANLDHSTNSGVYHEGNKPTPAEIGALAIGGTAAAATKLATARTISLSGDVSGSVSFDGSSNVTLTATVADDSHNHTIANVDGLQTSLNGKVPTTRTVNGKALSANITLSAGDVGAYTKAEADARFEPSALQGYSYYAITRTAINTGQFITEGNFLYRNSGSSWGADDALNSNGIASIDSLTSTSTTSLFRISYVGGAGLYHVKVTCTTLTSAANIARLRLRHNATTGSVVSVASSAQGGAAGSMTFVFDFYVQRTGTGQIGYFCEYADGTGGIALNTLDVEVAKIN